jgi:hypothetical protein
VRPFPAGISGSIKLVDYQAVRHGDDVAVATYVNDERGLPRREAALPVPHDRDLGEALQGWRLVAAQLLALRRIRLRSTSRSRCAASTS